MTVFVTKRHGSTPGVYHTDGECHQVGNMDDPREFPSVEALPFDVPECTWCAGEADTSENSFDHYRSLKEAAEGGSA